MPSEDIERPDRYCASCGTLVPHDIEACAVCGRPWEPAVPPEDVPTLVALLHAAGEWTRRGLLDPASGRRLRDHLESRLGAAAERARVAAAEAAAQPPPTPSLVAWAAARPADLLLYLATFIAGGVVALVLASIGDPLGGAVRVAIVAATTGACIGTGLVARRRPAVREAGDVLLTAGALAIPAALALLYEELLWGRGVPADVAWLVGAVGVAVAYGALARWGYGVGYWWLAGAAAVVAWTAAAFVAGVPIEWLAPWYLAPLTAAVIVVALARRLEPWVLALAGALAGVAAINATAAAVAGNGHHWQLAATFALCAIGVAAAGAAYRAYVALPVVAGIVLGAAIAALWAAGAGPAWYAYPALAMGALAVATRRWWVDWNVGLARFGWAFAAAAALVPPAALALDDSWHRAGVCVGGAALLLLIAWQDRDLGIVRGESDDEPTMPAERLVFGWMAFALLLAAIAAAQQRAGVVRPDTGWAFLGVTVVLLLALAVTARGRPFRELALLPPAVAAGFVGLQLPVPYAGHDAVVLGVAATASVLAAAAARRWTTLLAGAVAAVTAAAAAWAALGWPVEWLAVTYSAAGAVCFALLIPHRRYDSEGEADVAKVVTVELLSWGGAVGGPATAAIGLQRALLGGAVLAPDALEYRAVAALILAIAPLLAIEGWRLHAKPPLIAATADVMVAGLMAIALLHPANVQAYTVPAALYLIALGLVFDASPDLWEPHLALHEASQFAGAAVLVLPQLAQTFDSGGAAWGLVLVLEGALFIAVALVRDHRWLAIAGFLTLVGIGARGFAAGAALPDAVALLVVAGGAALAVTVAREKPGWWGDVRERAAVWWRRPPGKAS